MGFLWSSLISYNITSCKQTKEQLREAMILQKAILDSAEYSIISTDINGNIQSFNRGAEKLLGYSAEEIIGKTPAVFHDLNEIMAHSEILSAELGEKIDPGFEVFVAKAKIGIVFEKEWTYIRKDSSRCQVMLSITSIKDNFGNITGFLGIANNISPRIHSQAEIDRFFTLSLDMLCIANMQGYFIRLNPVWEDVLGYTQAELMSQPYLEFIHPDDIESTIAEASKLSTGAKTLKFENRYRCKDGSYRWLEWNVAPFVEDSTLYCTVRDNTERTQAEIALKVEMKKRRTIEKDLRSLTARLEQSNRELQDFAYVASHDLQEPLRKIQTFGDRLKAKFSDVLTDQGRDYLDRMQNAAHRSQKLINDLLSFSRISTKTQPFTTINLINVIEGVLSDMEVRIEQVNGQIEIGDLPNLEADPLQMQQLFQNLLGNALKFHRDEITPTIQIQGKVIEAPVSYTQDADNMTQWCEITVADNGIGFEEKYLDRIFNVFQRLHNRTVYEGTGVGLAICRKIVERHHGNITATSTPGNGATFIITLPIKQLPEVSI